MLPFVVATSVLGPLEVHRSGCQHTARLYHDGGGVLSDFATLDEARRRPPRQQP
jgi:hypothetical protein